MPTYVYNTVLPTVNRIMKLRLEQKWRIGELQLWTFITAPFKLRNKLQTTERIARVLASYTYLQSQIR